MSSSAKFMRTVLWLAVIAASFLLGARIGGIYVYRELIYELPTGENIRASLRTLLRLQPSYSQFGQDVWVAVSVGRGKRDGYYVDVGSADGIAISNTYLLDRMGWKGVCIDPFPKNMQKRTCQIFQQPVFSVSGKKVQFRAAGVLGGIEAALGSKKESLTQAPLVELETARLDEILEKAKAPRWIDYLNLDVEGAEYDALLGLSFDRYQVGAFTIEHNYESEKRDLIRKLLDSKGYVRVRSVEVDDWYVHRNLASQYKTYIAYSSR